MKNESAVENQVISQVEVCSFEDADCGLKSVI